MEKPNHWLRLNKTEVLDRRTGKIYTTLKHIGGLLIADYSMEAKPFTIQAKSMFVEEKKIDNYDLDIPNVEMFYGKA